MTISGSLSYTPVESMFLTSVIISSLSIVSTTISASGCDVLYLSAASFAAFTLKVSFQVQTTIFLSSLPVEISPSPVAPSDCPVHDTMNTPKIRIKNTVGSLLITRSYPPRCHQSLHYYHRSAPDSSPEVL